MTDLIKLILDEGGPDKKFIRRGYCQIAPNVRFPDMADSMIIGRRAETVWFDKSPSPPYVMLLPCDLVGPQNDDDTPGWDYVIKYSSDFPGKPQPWAFRLLSTNGSEQKLSDLMAFPVARSGSLYVPWPITAPGAGQIFEWDGSKTVAIDNPGPALSTALSTETSRAEAAEAGLLSKSAGGTVSGNVAFTGETTAQTPSNPTDVAIKSYVDGVAAGLSIKQSVQAATTAVLPANTYNNGSSGVGATLTATGNAALTIDGVSVEVNDRILVKDETSAANNGIYSVTDTGSGSTPYILTRATDMDTAADFPGAFVFTEGGTANAGFGYVIANEGPFTVGTTAVNWTKFSSLPVPVPIEDGGTGATDAATALANLGALPISGGELTGPLAIGNGFSSEPFISSADGTDTSHGALLHLIGADNTETGHYVLWNDETDPAYIGLAMALRANQTYKGKPIIALGGYYGGWGVQGSSHDTGQPIFGVLTSAESGSGLGHTALTIFDDKTVVTFNNTLDDGAGNAIIAGAAVIKLASGNALIATTDGSASSAGLVVNPGSGQVIANGAVYIGGSGGPVLYNDSGNLRADFPLIAELFQPTGLTGATVASRYVGGTNNGPPSSGSFLAGDFVVDNEGQIWVCNTAGSPGSWSFIMQRNAADSSIQPSPGTRTAGSVFNSADAGHVHGQPPMFAPTGLTGATAATRYVGATASGAPVSGNFAVGDFVIDQTAVIWICTIAGSPGTWVKVPHLNQNTANVAVSPGAVAVGTAGLAAQSDHVHGQPPMFAPTGLTGATAASRYVGATASGHPSSGTFAVGDFAVEQSGAIFTCTAAGSPGTWARLGIIDINPGDIAASPGTAIAGGAGKAADAAHVHGQPPMFAPTGLTGATAATRYVGATASGAPASGTFAVGDFVIAQNAAVWVCVSAGTPGTWNKLANLNGNAANIQPVGTANAAGSAGSAADAGHVHATNAPWVPADDGFLAASVEPAVAASTAITVAGTLYLMRINLRQAITATNICVGVTTGGDNTGGSTGTYVGLYNSSGTLLSGSADVAASFLGSGFKTIALTTPQALTPGVYYVAILTNLGTTQPILAQTGFNTVSWGSVGQSAANLRFSTNGTGRTALPSPSITPSSNSVANTHGYFVGIT